MELQFLWEKCHLWKHYICKFTTTKAEHPTLERKQTRMLSENKLKELEGNLNMEDNIQWFLKKRPWVYIWPYCRRY